MQYSRYGPHSVLSNPPQGDKADAKVLMQLLCGIGWWLHLTTMAFTPIVRLCAFTWYGPKITIEKVFRYKPSGISFSGCCHVGLVQLGNLEF